MTFKAINFETFKRPQAEKLDQTLADLLRARYIELAAECAVEADDREAAAEVWHMAWHEFMSSLMRLHPLSIALAREDAACQRVSDELAQG